MKRLFHLTFALFLLATVTSCSSDFNEAERAPQSEEPIAHTVSHYVTADEALQTVMEFFTLDETRAALPEVKSHSIYRPNTTTRSDDSKYEVLFHVFNFEDNGGYAIVSADDRTTDIYAYSETGNIDMDEALDNPGFNIFMNNAAIYFEEEIEASTSGLNPPDRDLPPFKPAEPPTGGGGGEDDVTKYMITYLDGVPYHTKTTTTISQNIAAKTTTKWHQDTPYNSKCLINNQLALAGCGPIAIAQIMAYYEYPNVIKELTLDWPSIKRLSYVPSSTNDAHAVSTLIREIGRIAETQYGVEASSTEVVKIRPTFVSFGYAAGNLQSYNKSIVQSSLDNDHLVLMTGYNQNGIGHAWIADGYKVKKESTSYYYTTPPYSLYKTINEYTTYINCNWGWGNAFTTECLSGVFSTQRTDTGGSYNDFSNNVRIIPDINH